MEPLLIKKYSLDEHKKLLKNLTDPKQNRYKNENPGRTADIWLCWVCRVSLVSLDLLDPL